VNTFVKKPNLKMQDFTEKDIRLYIERQLMKNNEEAAALTTEIANKAKGLFL